MKLLFLVATVFHMTISYAQEPEKFYMVIHNVERVLSFEPNTPKDIDRFAKFEYSREMYDWLMANDNWITCRVIHDKEAEVFVYQGNVGSHHPKAQTAVRTCETSTCKSTTFEKSAGPKTFAHNYWYKKDVQPQIEYGFKIHSQANYIQDHQEFRIPLEQIPEVEIYSPSRHPKIPVVNGWYCRVFSNDPRAWVDHPFPLKSSGNGAN